MAQTAKRLQTWQTSWSPSFSRISPSFSRNFSRKNNFESHRSLFLQNVNVFHYIILFFNDARILCK